VLRLKKAFAARPSLPQRFRARAWQLLKRVQTDARIIAESRASCMTIGLQPLPVGLSC